MKKLSLINVHDYTDVGEGKAMIRRYSAYPEIFVLWPEDDRAMLAALDVRIRQAGQSPDELQQMEAERDEIRRRVQRYEKLNAGDGWVWTAQIMSRTVSGMVLETIDGVAPTEDKAREASQLWVQARMERYRLEFDQAAVDRLLKKNP